MRAYNCFPVCIGLLLLLFLSCTSYFPVDVLSTASIKLGYGSLPHVMRNDMNFCPSSVLLFHDM